MLVSDAAGNASWEDRSFRVVTSYDGTSNTLDGYLFTGWEDFSGNTSSLDVDSGDVVVIHMDFRFRIKSGSSNDDIEFRIAREGINGCSDNSGNSSGSLGCFQNLRGEYMPVHRHHTEVVSCSGSYRFYLEVYLGDTDDPVTSKDIIITAVRY